MLWWLAGALSCVLLVAVIIFFWTTGQRYKVFSEKSLRPPGPLVTDKKQRDDRLKKGEKNSLTETVDWNVVWLLLTT